MEKSELLIELESYVGKYAWDGNNLIQIKKIETFVQIKQKKVGGTFFKPKYEYTEYLEAKTIYWNVIGDMVHMWSSKYSIYAYDWKKMINKADIILAQAEIIFNENKEKEERRKKLMGYKIIGK